MALARARDEEAREEIEETHSTGCETSCETIHMTESYEAYELRQAQSYPQYD